MHFWVKLPTYSSTLLFFKRVVVESDGGNLIAIGLGKKAILVAMSSEGVRIATANS